MNKDETRAYFKGVGLEYSLITEAQLLSLQGYLADELKRSQTGMTLDYMKTKIKIKNDRLQEAYFIVNGDYFKGRECISFNQDGFIGFAGWADVDNSSPIIKAFLRWCDNIAIDSLLTNQGGMSHG